MGKRRKKILPPTTTSAEGFKNSLTERAGTIAPCFKEMTKVADDFFLLFFGDLTCQQMVEQDDEVVWFYNYIENYWIQKIPLGFLSV